MLIAKKDVAIIDDCGRRFDGRTATRLQVATEAGIDPK